MQAMNENERLPRRLRLPDRFLERSDAWGWRGALRLLGAPLIQIALLPVWASISPWLAIAAGVPLGVSLSKATLLVHETLHGSLFRTPVLNQAIGRLAGWWTVVDFATFEGLHWTHHRTIGEEDEDPQFLDYAVLQTASRGQLLWHLLRPLFGWNLRHMLTLLRARLRASRGWRATLAELTGLLAVQSAFFWLATGGGAQPWLALIIPFSALTVGLFMSQIRGFCEHTPMPRQSGKMLLRSHTSNWLERLLIHDLNYNYHGEHHRYPRVSGKHLPALSQWLAEQGEAIERSPSYWATIAARWRACEPS